VYYSAYTALWGFCIGYALYKSMLYLVTYFADFFLLCELTEVIPRIGQISTSTEGTMYFVRAYNHSL